MSNDQELAQASVLHLTVSEAEHLLNRVRGDRTLMTYGVEVYTIPGSPMPLVNPTNGEVTNHPGAVVMVRAETERQCGIGKGFLLAIFGGISK